MNAIAADDEYFERTKVEGIYPLMYYTHNYQFLSAAAGMIRADQSRRSKAVSEVANGRNAAPDGGSRCDCGLRAAVDALCAGPKTLGSDDILAYPEPPSARPQTVANVEIREKSWLLSARKM
jgi:hypothetical protein